MVRSAEMMEAEQENVFVGEGGQELRGVDRKGGPTWPLKVQQQSAFAIVSAG